MFTRGFKNAANLRLNQVSLIHTKTGQDSSGIRNLKVQKLPQFQRPERISEILNRVEERDGLEWIPAHVHSLLGGDSSKSSSSNSSHTNTGEYSGREVKSLDLRDKTQFIFESQHPVRYFLERDLYNHSKPKKTINYLHWVTLFGRGIQVSDDPNYEKINRLVALASEVGMFSSDVHQCVADVPEEGNELELEHFRLGNKYATLVGDYFAIRCISHAQQTRKSSVMMAITKGLAEFTTASFAAPLMDSAVMYPILPHPEARVEDWIRYNKKASGYFNGGLYASVVVNYEGLPKNQEFMKHFKTFSSNLSVFLKGIAEIDAIKTTDHFSSVFPFVLVSLPGILYQIRNPGAFDSLRGRPFQIHTSEELRKVSEEIESSSVITEAQRILSGMATEAQNSFEKISRVPCYTNIVNELIDVISTPD